MPGVAADTGVQSILPRQPSGDRSCFSIIPSTDAGYCECVKGTTERNGCGHPEFTCAEICSRFEDWRQGLNSRFPIITAVTMSAVLIGVLAALRLYAERAIFGDSSAVEM